MKSVTRHTTRDHEFQCILSENVKICQFFSFPQNQIISVTSNEIYMLLDFVYFFGFFYDESHFLLFKDNYLIKLNF